MYARSRSCNVRTGRPIQLDPSVPKRLAESIALMKLDYVVITSVDRDDLRDGAQLVSCRRTGADAAGVF